MGWKGLYQTSGSYRGPVALRQLGVIGCWIVALVRTGLG